MALGGSHSATPGDPRSCTFSRIMVALAPGSCTNDVPVCPAYDLRPHRAATAPPVVVRVVMWEGQSLGRHRHIIPFIVHAYYL